MAEQRTGHRSGVRGHHGGSRGPVKGVGPHGEDHLISMDTLRSDRLGSLGHPGHLTPTWTWIAGEGALFTQAFSTDIPTQPSHTAVFTGRFGINTSIVFTSTRRPARRGRALAAVHLLGPGLRPPGRSTTSSP